jgi:transcriptional regulator with XRE-family HTH domain
MEHMKRIREAKGLTLAELGERTGLNRHMLGRYENGRQSPSLDRAALVARALGVSLDVLAGSDSPPELPTRASGCALQVAKNIEAPLAVSGKSSASGA